MKTLNPNVYPKGGHLFRESDGAKIYGSSWPGVIQHVIAYRKRAGYPPGDPSVEVITQACQRDPTLCQEVSSAYHEQLRATSLKTRVLQWMNKVRADKEKAFVDEGLARERAAICAKCKNNTPLPGGCASCKAAVKELRKELVGSRFVDGRLEACMVTGEDLPTSANLEQQAIQSDELPAQCWRKRTL